VPADLFRAVLASRAGTDRRTPKRRVKPWHASVCRDCAPGSVACQEVVNTPGEYLNRDCARRAGGGAGSVNDHGSDLGMWYVPDPWHSLPDPGQDNSRSEAAACPSCGCPRCRPMAALIAARWILRGSRLWRTLAFNDLPRQRCRVDRRLAACGSRALGRTALLASASPGRL